MVLYCAISGPTRELSDLSEVILAAVVAGAAVGVIDPPLPPSSPDKMRGRKGKGLRIINPFVVISSSMGGIPPCHRPWNIGGKISR